MANSKKRSPVSSLVEKAAIEEASLFLEQLPEKPREVWSLRESIDHLYDSITNALKKGYSYEELSAILTAGGIRISPSSLKSYLAAAKRELSKAPKTRGTRQPKARSKRALSGELVAATAADLTTQAAGSQNGYISQPTADEPTAEPPKKRGRKPKTTTAAKAAPTARTKTAARVTTQSPSPRSVSEPTAQSKKTPKASKGNASGAKGRKKKNTP